MARGDNIVRRNGCTARELNDGGRFLILARERLYVGRSTKQVARGTTLYVVLTDLSGQ